MKNSPLQNGFSAVELLITLFVASLFLTAGYQIWGYVQKSGAESDQFAKASNIAYSYLRRYTLSPPGSCTASTVLPATTPDNSDDLPNAKVTIVVSCPNAATPGISKFTSTVTYSANPTRSVTHAIYTN